MSRVSVVAFGLLMVGAAAYPASGPALAVAGCAAAAVLASAWVRPAATVAVLLAVLTIVLAEPAPVHAVVSGLAAAMYLVVRHADLTTPTAVFAIAFAAVAALVVIVPVQVAWLPLLAPLALLAAYLLAVRPFLR